MLVLWKAAGAAVAAMAGTCVIGSTARNMVQTHRALDNTRASSSSWTKTSPPLLLSSPPTTVEELHGLSRAELLHIYMHQCHTPEMDTNMDDPTTNPRVLRLEGDWHGVLLNNNGLVRACACF